jgi:MFS family permease
VDSKPSATNYRWYILILAALTATFVSAAPMMCMPVLFDEIARELDLSLVQVGLVWGIGALAGTLTGMVAGAISDRLGARRALYISCMLAGPVGALRGFADDLVTLAATVFLLGLVMPMVMMSITKTCGLWFSRRQLGLANGIVAMGIALGFMVSSLISATTLSPWLGGWRNVLFFYSGIAMTFSVPWYLSQPSRNDVEVSVGKAGISLRQTIAHVIQIRNVWLMGLVLLGIGGCVDGTTGYLPLYLRGLGWPDATADGVLSTFSAASMVFVLPIALWSDRLITRKRVLMVAALILITGVGLLSVVDGEAVWGAVSIAGLIRDGFMAVFMTMLIETEGVGTTYMGTAMGLVMFFSGMGRLLAPPLGNSLAYKAPALPFVFWASLAVVGFLALLLVREGKALK